MNILDIIIILCCCPFLIGGYKKGFINQVISILALIGGVWIASALDKTVGGWILPLIQDKCDSPEIVANIMGFGLVFLITCIILSLLGKVVEKMFMQVIPEWINKILGLIMAAVNAILVVCTLYIVFDVLNKIYFITETNQALFTDSLLFPVIESTANAIMPNLTEIAYNFI